MYYEISEGTDRERDQARELLGPLGNIGGSAEQKIITAWISAWKSSAYQSLADAPYSDHAPEIRLMDHVRDVNHFGIRFAEEARNHWGREYDLEELVCILALHDVDKPLMFTRRGNEVVKSDIAKNIQHGVLGAMILTQLGFSQQIINTVATHAVNSPFHGENFCAFVLNYADMFASDYALMKAGRVPYYQK